MFKSCACCCQTFNKSCEHTTHSLACVCSTLPRWTRTASHMDSYVCNTMLKGSFHNGPWWGWDDGYGLSLGVNKAGLRPPQVYTVTSFAICQHWVGTNPWPGLGQHIPGPHLTLRAGWGGRQDTQELHRRAVHLHILYFNLLLLSSNDCYCYTYSHWNIHYILFHQLG